MNLPAISVVIPCRNEEEYIIPCIQSVLANEYPSEKIEILVCDGLSNDGTVTLLKEFSQQYKNVKVLHNEKLTTPYALNMGIENSSGEIIFILGAHAEMQNNYLITCVNLLKEKSDVWCCGGVLKNESKDKLSEIISLAMTSPFGVGSAHFRTGAKEGYVDTVAFGAYRREIFSLIGLFDNELTRNQDDEFNFRLLKGGKKIWLSSATSIKYFVRGSWRKLWKQYFQYGYWKVFVNKKYKTVTTIRQLVPCLFLLFLITGFIICVFIPSLFLPYILVNIIYLIIGFVFALQKSKNIISVFSILFTFLILHLSYGGGYLSGIIDFVIFAKAPATKEQQLTR